MTLAESEATCAVLAKAFSARLDKGTECQHRIAGPGGFYACQPCLDALNADIQLVLNLPASVRAHMKEDAALREVAVKAALIWKALSAPGADSVARYSAATEHGFALRDALAAVDAVRAKHGGG